MTQRRSPLKWLFIAVLAYGRFFGFISFKYPSNIHKFSLVSIFLMIINLMLTVVTIILVFYQLNDFSKSVNLKENSSSYVMGISLLSTLIITQLFRFVTLFLNFGFSKRIFNSLKMIENMDEEFHKIGINVNYRREIKFIALVLIIKLSTIILISVSMKVFSSFVSFLYNTINIYAVIEIYFIVLRIFRAMIITFRKEFMYV